MSGEGSRELTAAYAPPAAPQTEMSEHSISAHGDALASGYRARSLLVRGLSGLLLMDALWLGLNFVVSALNVFAPSTTAALGEFYGSLQEWLKVVPVFRWIRVVLFAWFLVGSNKNARAFMRAEEPRKRVQPPLLSHFSPASMVWWFAVPIFNLFKPYSAVNAVWNASQPTSGSAQNEPASVTWHWWLSYLSWLTFFAFHSFVVLMLSRWSEPNVGLALHHFRSSPAFIALQALTNSAAVLFAWRMVLALHERQRQRAAELWPTNSQR